MKKTKKLLKPLSAISVLLATILISITMSGCFFGGAQRFDAFGYYELYAVHVFNHSGFLIEDWHWTDWDFYDEWGDSFVYFDSWDYAIDIWFDDWDWYHSDLNGFWYFDLWRSGCGFYLDIHFDWWTADLAWDYEFFWCSWYDEFTIRYLGLFRIYEFIFVPVW